MKSGDQKESQEALITGSIAYIAKLSSSGSGALNSGFLRTLESLPQASDQMKQAMVDLAAIPTYTSGRLVIPAGEVTQWISDHIAENIKKGLITTPEACERQIKQYYEAFVEYIFAAAEQKPLPRRDFADKILRVIDGNPRLDFADKILKVIDGNIEKARKSKKEEKQDLSALAAILITSSTPDKQNKLYQMIIELNKMQAKCKYKERFTSSEKQAIRDTLNRFESKLAGNKYKLTPPELSSLKKRCQSYAKTIESWTAVEAEAKVIAKQKMQKAELNSKHYSTKQASAYAAGFIAGYDTAAAKVAADWKEKNQDPKPSAEERIALLQKDASDEARQLSMSISEQAEFISGYIDGNARGTEKTQEKIREVESRVAQSLFSPPTAPTSSSSGVGEPPAPHNSEPESVEAKKSSPTG